MKQITFLILFFVFLNGLNCCPRCGRQSHNDSKNSDIVPGAYQTLNYFPLIENKRIGFVGNHTSKIGEVHLVDTLIRSGFKLVRIFSPEHGFRGKAAAGEYVEDGTDIETGVPVISLYGKNRRPKKEQLIDIDVIIFDIQDVGARFYTYISTMTYVMEEAAKNNIPVIILDRPNPNGHYVDGPVLEPEYSSFVGLHPIPVVHGMTVGEYALMVNGEGWLKDNLESNLTIIQVANYDRSMPFNIKTKPSPNLPNMTAIYLYPSLCFFEGTEISVGRGTNKPFQIFGHPSLPENIFNYEFVPESVPAAPEPPLLNKTCNGMNLSEINPEKIRNKGYLDLSYLLMAYKNFPDKDNFFNNFFDLLAGTDKLRKQIINNYTEKEIRQSWEKDLSNFKKIREKYLIY